MKTRRLGLLVASIVLIAIPAPAQAAPGDVIGQTCISKTGTGGCAPLPQPAVLEAAAGVAISPDGADVYVGGGGGIAHFRRAADGTVTYASCADLGSSPLDRCPTASAPPDAGGALSTNSINVAISPDGKHVYAVSWADALLWWARDPATGNLTWGGCRDGAADSATNGRCGTGDTFAEGNFPAGSMAFTQGIAITPDGQTIYISDQTGGLLQAQRNGSTGAATPTACFDTTGSAAAGCTAIASDVPMSLGGIDVASNSRDVYVRSISPGGIAHFSRTPGGATSLTSCVVNSLPTASCATAAPAPVFAYSGSLGVAGDLVFTYGGNYGTPSGTVARLARNPNGSLAYESCATTEAAPGPCALLPAQSAGGSNGRLLVDPDASSVYLPQGGTTERALTRLSGSLGFASCISDTGVAACSAPPLPGPFGAANGQMVLSPDGRQIYQAAADTLNVYDVEQVPAVPPPGGDPGPGGGGGTGPTAPPVAPPKARPAAAAKPRIRSVERGRDGRYRVRVRVFQAGIVRARFTGRLKRKAKTRTLGKVATRRVARPGTYTLRVKPSRAARKRKLKAKLVVSIAAAGYLPAQSSRAVRLR